MAYRTPVGIFSYHQIPELAYPLGVDFVQLNDGGAFLLATPEKALADKLHGDRGRGLTKRSELRDILIADLRIDLDRLRSLDKKLIFRIAKAYRSRRIRWLGELI